MREKIRDWVEFLETFFIEVVMKRTAFSLVLLLQIGPAGCSKTGPPTATAIIHVTVGSPSTAGTGTNANTIANDDVKMVFESYDLAQHANETLGLAKLWGDSDKQVWEKLSGSISVRKGNGPGLFVIEVHGLDHELAVRVLNELCSDYCSKQTSISVNGGKDEAVHAAIVEAAH
jgi:hypothetical protein